MPLVAELADVVVLHDPGADPGGPAKKSEAALEKHDDARGELMARRHVGEPRARTGGRQPGGIEPTRVDGHPDEPASRRLERYGDAGIVRLLHHGAVAGIEEDARDQVEGLLRAVHDHDALGVAPYAAGAPEILAERLAERTVAGRRAVAERLACGSACPCGEEPPPDLARELVHRWAAVAEVVARGFQRRGGSQRRHEGLPDEPARVGREPRRRLELRPRWRPCDA